MFGKSFVLKQLKGSSCNELAATKQWDKASKYKKSIEKYLSAKQKEGKALDENDWWLGELLKNSRAPREKLGAMMRALRHYDEIGITSELVETLEEWYDDPDTTAVSWIEK